MSVILCSITFMSRPLTLPIKVYFTTNENYIYLYLHYNTYYMKYPTSSSYLSLWLRSASVLYMCEFRTWHVKWHLKVNNIKYTCSNSSRSVTTFCFSLFLCTLVHALYIHTCTALTTLSHKTLLIFWKISTHTLSSLSSPPLFFYLFILTHLIRRCQFIFFFSGKFNFDKWFTRPPTHERTAWS